ncbi:MAG: putative primase/helicase [Nocardioidaceae bacterium]|jgi:P4 family phage/plasmid primase-like protien|nr:putative primase/helicase [Nocardioidaceae bacterium]
MGKKKRSTSEASTKTLVPDPDHYFTKGGGLRVRTLARAVEKAGVIASDESSELYWYTDGVWHRGGAREVENRTRLLLDERWRSAHAANVVKWFAVRPATVSDRTANTDLLNLPNGLLDWQTGELREHSPSVNTIARIPVPWDPDAECPQIDEWVRQVVSEDCVPLVFEVIGYALYNGNPLHKALLLYGTGRNGKGTFLRLLKQLLGVENVAAVTPQSLDENRFTAAELHGKLANLVGDVDPRIFKATERFKQATGDDLITAERKYGQPFTFTCRALMVCAFNAYPRSTDATEGFFSRWVVLPFTGYFPAGVADPSIEDKLQDDNEMRGLLVAAVEGLRRVMTRRQFSIPASVHDATREFREAADPVRAFVAERVTVGEAVARTRVYDFWCAWCETNGHEHGAARRLYERLPGAVMDILDVHIEDGKSHGSRVFRGIDVTMPELPPGMTWHS